MRNTTKLKHILRLYRISLDMDEDGNISLTMMNKKDSSYADFTSKSYTTVIAKAFGHLKKKLREELTPRS